MIFSRLLIILAFSLLTVPGVFGMGNSCAGSNSGAATPSVNLGWGGGIDGITGEGAPVKKTVHWNSTVIRCLLSPELTVTTEENQYILETRSTITYVNRVQYKVISVSDKAMIVPREKFAGVIVNRDGKLVLVLKTANAKK